MHDVEVRLNGWGQGMFTTIALNKGEVICPLGGPIVRPDYPMRFQVGANTWMGPSQAETDHLNHSCNPNAAAMVEEPGYPVRAIRNINTGEEITIDYSVTSTSPSGGVFQCRCGAINCRGMGAGGFHSIPAWQQERYLQLGIVPRYVTDHYLASLT